MKSTLTIFALAVAALAMQSCDTKSNDQKAEDLKSDTVASATKSANMHELGDNQRLEFIEQRNDAVQALILETPFYTNSNGDIVFNKAEVEPNYIGGEKAMNKFLRSNLKYPSDAKDEGREGTVFVDFIIANDGSVGNVKASTDTWGNVDEQLLNEAVRVVSNMPNWVPGTQHGSPVNVAFSLPIDFRMN